MFGKLFGNKSKNEAPEATPPVAPSKASSQAPPVTAKAQPPAPSVPPIEPAPRPPATAGDGVASVSRTAQAGAAHAADVAGVIEQAIRAGAAGNGAPITPDAVKALRTAAESLATADDVAAAQAIAAFNAGRLMDGFQALRQDADAQTGPAQVERLRRLGALAFLVDGGASMQAYLDAWRLDQRDFWNGVYLARLQGLGGAIAMAKATMEQAIAEARTPSDRSQGEAELALIALGLNDADGARRHGQAAVDVLRPAQAPLDLAARLSLLGDIAVMITDGAMAAAAYGEALQITKGLGAQAPSDITLARAAADTQEKLAAVISRQNRHADAIAAGAQAVDLRRRLAAARPGEPLDVAALATVLNTFGEIHRLAGDAAAAAGANREAVAQGRKVLALAANHAGAHREIWVGLWRLADAGAASWAEVKTALQAAKAEGALLDRDVKFLSEAERRAGGAT
jgi:hypothetical protein